MPILTIPEAEKMDIDAWNNVHTNLIFTSMFQRDTIFPDIANHVSLKTSSWVLALTHITVFDHRFLEAECKDTKLDILFVLDGSGSIRKVNFATMKKFIQKLNERFSVGPDESQRAAIQFGEPVKTRIEFNLGEESTLQEVNEGVEEIKYLRSQTATGDALRKSREEVRLLFA